MADRDLSSTDSHPKGPQWPGLNECEARIQQLHPTLPHKCQRPQQLGHLSVFFSPKATSRMLDQEQSNQITNQPPNGMPVMWAYSNSVISSKHHAVDGSHPFFICKIGTVEIITRICTDTDELPRTVLSICQMILNCWLNRQTSLSRL